MTVACVFVAPTVSFAFWSNAPDQFQSSDFLQTESCWRPSAQTMSRADRECWYGTFNQANGLTWERSETAAHRLPFLPAARVWPAAARNQTALFVCGICKTGRPEF